MKRTILLSLLSLCMSNGMIAKAPQPVNPPAELPAGMTVYPSQGFVNTANTAYPLGVSRIALSFAQEVMPNPNNTASAVLYYNDFENPAETTLVTSVDHETWQTVAVVFKTRQWVLTGQYKVEIPEGMFCYVDGHNSQGDRTGSRPVPGVTLYYEIYKGFTVTPSSGSVAQLSKAVVTFTNAFEVKPTDKASEIQFYLDNSTAAYGCGYRIEDSDADGLKNNVVFNMEQSDGPVTTPGIYGLNIPDGAFTFKVPGPNYPDDPEDYALWSNQEILMKYTIPRGPQPEIDPDPNYAVKSFDTFLLYVPEGVELNFADTMGHSPLYGVDAEGDIDTTYTYAYAKADFYEPGSPFVTLRLYDPFTHELLDTYIPPKAGMYCLRTVPSLLYGTWPAAIAGGKSFTGGSDMYDYFYTVEKQVTGTSALTDEGQSQDSAVYNLHGVKVAESIDNNLPRGLYITAGKKIVVK